MKKISILAGLATLLLSSCLSSQIQEVAGYYHELGDEYYNQKKFDKAAEFYQKSLTLQGNQRQILYNLALIYVEQKRFAEARRPLEEFLRQDPENILAQKALAYSYFQEGDYRRSEQLYQKIYQQTPEDSKLLYNIGTVLHLQGKFEQSQDAFTRLETIEEGTEREKAYPFMVLNLIELNQPEQASIYQERMVAGGQHKKEDIAKILELYRKKGWDAAGFQLLVLVEKKRALTDEEAWDKAELSFTSKQGFSASLEILESLLDKEYKSLDGLEKKTETSTQQLAEEKAKKEKDEKKIDSLQKELKKEEEKLKEANDALGKRVASLKRQASEGGALIDDLIQRKEKEFAEAKQAKEKARKAKEAEEKAKKAKEAEEKAKKATEGESTQSAKEKAAGGAESTARVAKENGEGESAKKVEKVATTKQDSTGEAKSGS